MMILFPVPIRLAPQQALMTSQSKEAEHEIRQNTLAVQNSTSNEKMNKHLQEWQDMKPDIARLAALEGEVKELIKQLKSMNDRISDQSTSIMQTSAVNDSAAVKQQKLLSIAEKYVRHTIFFL